jgi:hypothetical protein
MRGGYAPESLRFEIPEARKSEMNKDRQIWRTYEDRWIRVVGQQTMSARMCGRPRQHEHVPHEIHVSKTTSARTRGAIRQ